MLLMILYIFTPESTNNCDICAYEVMNHEICIQAFGVRKFLSKFDFTCHLLTRCRIHKIVVYIDSKCMTARLDVCIGAQNQALALGIL